MSFPSANVHTSAYFDNFANLTPAHFAAMGIPPARQLGQPQEVIPATGSPTYRRQVINAIKHIRISPFDHSARIQCTPLGPGTLITVILDPLYSTWAYVQVPGVLKGWVGRQHVSSAPAPSPAPTHVSVHIGAVALVPITYTYALPSFRSPQVGYIVPRGSTLIVIAVSSCGQWFQLHGSNTWIPASLVQWH